MKVPTLYNILSDLVMINSVIGQLGIRYYNIIVGHYHMFLITSQYDVILETLGHNKFQHKLNDFEKEPGAITL